MTTQYIVAKLWNLCNVLKDDGVTYHQYVSELTYLLFLKMAMETGTEQSKKGEAGLPQGSRRDDLEKKSAVDRIEAQYRTARARVDRLTQSLLAKAFKGELVPQDPNDEPAAVLLERIAAERATAPKPKRGGRKKAS
jgi:type I restriction-modification system DNA methylase subunit